MTININEKKELAGAFEEIIGNFIEDVCSEYNPLEVQHIFEEVLSMKLLKQQLPGDVEEQEKTNLGVRFPVMYRIQPYPEDVEHSKDEFEDYKLGHSYGHISIENLPLEFNSIGDLGVQIENGKVWVCINGVAFLRFDPNYKKYIKRGNG